MKLDDLGNFERFTSKRRITRLPNYFYEDKNDSKYTKDLGFIPIEGKLFVDTSGILFMGPYQKNRYKINWQRVQRAENCLKLFKKRRNVFTTKGVLSELMDRVNTYKEKKKKARKTKELNFEGIHTSLPDRSGAIMQRQKIHLKVYRNLYDYLSESSKGIDLGNKSERKCIYSFMCRVDENSKSPSKKLSVVDKELLIAAIYSGDSSGIFSSDNRMIDAYEKAVKYFSLSDCFIANAMSSKTEWI